jgi:acyl dehydratase
LQLDGQPAADPGRTQPARRRAWLETARPGERRRHPGGRTVTEPDNVLVSLLTQNRNPVHVDSAHSARTVFGRPLVESVVTIGIAIGLADVDVRRDDRIDVELRDVEHLGPVFDGDTLVAESELLEADPHTPGRRVVRTWAHNHRGEAVVRFDRVLAAPPPRAEPSAHARQPENGGGPLPAKNGAAAHRNGGPAPDERDSFGRYLEDFDVGAVYRHWPGRTITEFDDTWFSLLTMNQHPLHIDEAFASGTQHGQRLVNGLLVLSTAVGMSVPAVSGKAIANLGYESVTHAAPTFHGDTIYAETTVLDVKPSQSKPDRGVVYVETRVRNQRDEHVMTLRRKVLVPTRAAGDQEQVGSASGESEA